MAKLGLLFTLLAALAFASASKNANPFITGGVIVQPPNPFPFVCSLHLVWFADEHHICGASLINVGWLLTAAQCFFFPLRPTLYEAHCGALDLSQNEAGRQVRALGQIVVHPQFEIGATAQNFEFNVALARVAQPFTQSPTVSTIAFVGPTVGLQQIWTTMGWGVFQNNPAQQSAQLRSITLTQQTNTLCTNVEALEILPVFATTLCGSSVPSGPSTCVGDFGGPLVQPIGTNLFQQIGIAYGSHRPCGIGSSAFIDVRPFQPWIWTILLEI